MSGSAANLETLVEFVAEDPGLIANIYQSDIDGGVAAARLMNDVFEAALDATGVNTDGVISTADMYTLSAYVRAQPDLFNDFLVGHGDDDGDDETGYHLVQGDGGAYQFQGRNLVDTIGDAIYHVGFRIVDGRFQNEDGDQNERVADVAGWLNYFLNGKNIVWGGAGDDNLKSGNYSFALADAANEVFYAGAGDDRVNAKEGHDRVFAGGGHDHVMGGEGSDKLMGQGGNDRLFGEEGKDLMYGGLGHDFLSGGTGEDKLRGEDGNDELYGGDDADTLDGGAGDDKLGGDAGNDRMFGGAGADKVWGGLGEDALYGQGGNDRIGGNEGDDFVNGGAGDDTISGDEGNDLLNGSTGHDEIWGGDGLDKILGGEGNDKLSGNDGRDSIKGGDGNDDVWGGTGSDYILGQGGADKLRGDDGHDRIFGGNGKDEVWGNDGNDSVRGDAGDDLIGGGNGRDFMVGGAGKDRLVDWEDWDAADIFAFFTGDSGMTEATRDVIEGFTSGIDRIDLRGYGDLAWQSAGSFSGGGSAEVRFDGDYVLIDADGNGSAEESIELKWVDIVFSSDFIL